MTTTERKQAVQIQHVEALRAYIVAGERCDIRFDPPIHVIADRTTITVDVDRDEFVRFLPLSF